MGKISQEQKKLQREIIQSLNGPTALARLTGINKSTIDKLHQGTRGFSGTTRLLFRILQVLNSAGWLEDVIKKVQQIENEEN